jgi:nucleoside 2-deoxyribosyltransferase
MTIQRITICGSMHFFDEMLALKAELESMGFGVFMPDREGLDIDYAKLSQKEQIDLKQTFIDRHIAHIHNSDAILVANYNKNGHENYIGANSFLEMGIAYALGKKIFLLNDIPEQSNSAEIRGLKPIPAMGNTNIL